jgi:hypothetical protein
VFASAATNGFETRFAPEAQLTPDELQQVLALAGDCGIESVREVETYNMHPSSEFGISVKSRVEVNGRYELQKAMKVVNSHWEPHRTPIRDVKRRGDFWADSMPYTTTNVVFELRGERYRVKLEKDIRLTDCDSILLALSENRIEMESTLDPKKQARVRELAKIWKPDVLAWREETKDYFALYTLGKYRWRCILFRMVNGVVRIHEVGEMIT